MPYGGRSVEDLYWEEQKRKQEAKLKVKDQRDKDLDTYTAYVWAHLKPMPSNVINRKHRALSLMREFASRGFRKGASICAHRVLELDTAVQSGFAAVPRVMVDEQEGAFEVLMQQLGLPAGRGLDDYPVEGEVSDGDHDD